MTAAYKLANQQIREIAEVSDGTVQIHDENTILTGCRVFSISIRFDGLERVNDGLPVRAREMFHIVVEPTFPFDYPRVMTPHFRFSGFRHVQWKQWLCLYQSSADWRPEDGMYGFIARLDAWIRDAASNNLDPNDAPLHPPVAYPTVDRLIVPTVDTPTTADSPWFGFAILRERNHSTEIIDWIGSDQGPPAYSAPAILLHKDFPFEYPETVNTLLKELESHNIEYGSFLVQLTSYARYSELGTPLTVVLGTPMRRSDPGGRALQHLAVWEISAAEADKLRELNFAVEMGDVVQQNEAVEAVVNWSMSAKVGWCKVHEMRPEVTRRRDHSSPMAWFRGKNVAIWGCGAIGTHVAESIVRAGIVAVELVDYKKVTPGLLVRQGFEDADIGKFKAKALAERLNQINPDLDPDVSTNDLISRLTSPDPIPNVDLVIDCTASSAVRTALEYTLRDGKPRPAIVSIAIDHQASSVIATLSMPGHSGGTLDIFRRLKLEACQRSTLSRLLEAFWPRSSPTERFQPEPGCSEPTFIGSNADLAGLSARALNSVARTIATTCETHTGAGWLFEELGPVHTFSWTPDHTLRVGGQGYSVRVCSHAVREMRGWARRSTRTAGATIETGGLIFGELNEAAGVLWVSGVEGPPPDSEASENHFTCGTEGMENVARERHRRFRGSVDCIGSWHTHPTSTPHPSSVDIEAVAQLLASPGSSRRTCLVLILSGNLDSPTIGAYVFRKKELSENFICIQKNTSAVIHLGPPSEKPRDVGLALSGGGSRAIAFHLGCLRSLHDLDLLNRVQVISSVSGGSVISAMYAYSNDSFQEFEARVVELLRNGLQKDIFRQMFAPNSIRRLLQSYLAESVSFLVRMFFCLVHAVVRLGVPSSCNLHPTRKFSRTDVFRDVIAKTLFGNTLVRDVVRDSLHTVINATELRTGSAFRFGSKETGCWRFGTIDTESSLVADAVAASAAYPVLLPALERNYRFTKNGRITDPTRVLLTDGGIFENLAVSPMEPGRSPSISTNVYDPNYIICCDAGAGIFDDESYPTHWPCRMYRSFLTVFRKVQDATRNRLHRLGDNGEISGFALCYLGQQDDGLPWLPAGLPRREEVNDYPTDFAAMSTEDIDRLALRGELLMRFLVAYYLSDL